ncbi:MAG TPA: flagellar biosynthesis protein FlgL [Aliiroseovarius sp.]|nr:flagellar biosynthesis protein FlgL [Aliiroseovarius sp.]
MNSTSIGDLARVFQNRHLTTSLKSDMTRLGRELATGLRSDVSAAVSGDFGPMADIERLLTTLGARKTVTTEAALTANTMQTALEAVQENSRSVSSSLLSIQSNQSAATVQIAAENARERFDMLVSALNTSTAGRTLFGGAATDRAALASAADMLAALSTATAAETTASGVRSVVDAWFDTPGGGFETVGYLGSTSAMGAFQLGEGDAVTLDIRADAPALRDLMKSFATAALVAEGTLSGGLDQQVALLTDAGTQLIGDDQQFTAFRAGLGVRQERIESATVRNAAEETALGLARNGLIAVDPYDTAPELEAAYTQLETFYTVTARLSRLSFTDYMR